MNPALAPETPFKGLMPYTKEDEPFFFGRTRERDLITANLMASRLTLLYGPSGVGKSSVINAGVVSHLQTLARKNLRAHDNAESIVVVFSSWRDKPLEGLKRQIAAAASEVLPEVKGPSSPSPGLADFLQEWIETINSEFLIVLDQFEEYFLYHAQDTAAAATLAAELPRAINRPGLRANFLISIRDDGLARLDFFKGHIPNLFDNYLRIEHLDQDSAREAIERPIDRYNSLRSATEAVGIEPQLIDAVLKEVKVGQVIWSVAGQGAVENQTTALRIEAPFLQLVMTRLWVEEMKAGSAELRLETLKRLGGASNIVRSHLDQTMSALSAPEQEIAAQIFRYLVTPSGSKIALSASDLANYTELPEQSLDTVLQKLSHDVRILRPIEPPPGFQTATRYEIFHDVLATSILEWQARFTYEGKQASAKRSLEELLLPCILGAIADLTVPILPAGTVVVWLWMRQKSLALKKDLVNAIVSGWVIGWMISTLILLSVMILLSTDAISELKTLFALFVALNLRLLISPLGSVIATLRWHRKAGAQFTVIEILTRVLRGA